MRNRAILGLMLDTGLRRAEVVSLTPADLDLDNCLLTVTGKGNKQRRVPFSTNVRTLLIDWLQIRGDGEDTLFWLKAQGLRMMMRRIKEDVGLDRFYPHQLRHTAATALVRNNADPFTVQRILGHASLTTTQRYVSQSTHDLREKHAAASPFDALFGRQGRGGGAAPPASPVAVLLTDPPPNDLHRAGRTLVPNPGRWRERDERRVRRRFAMVG